MKGKVTSVMLLRDLSRPILVAPVGRGEARRAPQGVNRGTIAHYIPDMLLKPSETLTGLDQIYPTFCG
jgi:hypothetical protein